jgi:hypothetical protein
MAEVKRNEGVKRFALIHSKLMIDDCLRSRCGRMMVSIDAALNCLTQCYL